MQENAERLMQAAEESEAKIEANKQALRAYQGRKRDEIYELKKAQWALQDKVHKQEDICQARDEDLRKVQTELRNTIRLLRLNPYYDLGFTVSSRGFKLELETAYEDSYMSLKAYIIENGKPKNAYSLVFLGKSLFSWELGLRTDRSNYAHNVSTRENLAISISLQDRPTCQELKTYYERNKAKLIKKALGNYQELKARYEDIKAKYELNDFVRLASWRCADCDFFYVEHEVSDYEAPSCPSCGGGKMSKIYMVKAEA
jgi:hypothetical protein